MKHFYRIVGEPHKLANQIHNYNKSFSNRTTEETQHHRQELSDLYQAIVIATLLSGSSGSNRGAIGQVIKRFEEHYHGDIKLFSEHN